MKPTLNKFLLIAVALLLIVAATAMIFADRALDGWVRPWIEQQAGEALNGQVSIGRLSLQDGTLTFDNLAAETVELSLTVLRVEADFSFGSLLERRLDTLRIESPIVRIEPKEPDDKRTPSIGIPQSPPLTIDQLLISNGVARVLFGEQQVLLHDVDLQGAIGANMPFKIVALVGTGQNNPLLLRGEAHWNKSLIFSLQELTWQHRALLEKPVELELQTDGETRGSGKFKLASFDDDKLRELLAAFDMEVPLPEGLSFELNELSLSLDLIKEGLKFGLAVQSGQLHRSGTNVAFKELLVELRGQQEEWHALGSLSGPAATSVSFEANYAAGQANGTVRAEVADPDQLLQELSGTKPMGLAGRLQVETGFFWREGALEVTGRLRGQERKVADSDFRFDLAPLHGNLSWRQDGEQPGDFALSLQAGDRPLLKASGGLDRINYSLEALDRTLLATLVNPSLLPVELDIVTGVTSSGQLRRDAQDGWYGDLHLVAHRLGAVGLTTSDLHLQGRLEFDGDKLAFSRANLTADLAKGDELTGQLSGQFTARLAGQKFVVLLDQLTLKNVGYLAADGLSGLGSGSVQLRGLINGRLTDDVVQLDLTGSLAAGEVLAGALYADLSALPGQFTLIGAFETDTTTMKLQKLQVDLPGLGTLAGNGRLETDRVVFKGSIQLPDLAVGYNSHIGPTLVEMLPTLKDMDLAGSLTVDCELDWSTTGAQVIGDVIVKRLAAAWPLLQLDMTDGNGSLPFVLTTGAVPTEAITSTERTGELDFAVFAVGSARLEEGRLKLAASRNHLALRSQLVFDLAGGRVMLHDLAFGLGEAGPQGSLQVAVQEINLEALTKELNLPVMQGGITADLGKIRYADQQLSSEGVAEIEVFSGRFQVRNMRYLEPFSPYPVFTADIDFNGIDLYQATNTFDFGEINGVVDGYVHGLRLFGTTPSAFESRLESRPEGKRSISVKALNNLSVLSQGGIQAALSRGVYSFIDFYHYRKIGIFCALDNDNFVLKGMAVKNSDKTLIDGGLIPPRIDIVTSSANISFKEMIRRISRIKRASD